MSFLQGVGGDFLERLANGNMDPRQDDDDDNVGRVLSGAPPEMFQQHTADALRRTDPGAYSDHITPGIGGTNPLGGLLGGMLGGGMGGNMGGGMGGGLLGGALGGGTGGGMMGGGMGGGLLGSIAGSLIGNMLGRRFGAGGQLAGSLAGSMIGSRAASGGLQDLVRSLGLSSEDPNQMNDHDVARLASYAQQNDPDALAQTATEYREQPQVVRSLLGDDAYQGVASNIASAALGRQTPGMR